MWLYDILRQDFDYQGGWLEILEDSGELYQFDYPTKPNAPNVKPRIQSLARAAAAAGYALTFSEDGQYKTPSLKWAVQLKANETALNLAKSTGLPESKQDLLKMLTLQPDIYIEQIKGQRHDKRIVYLIVSASFAKSEGLHSWSEALHIYWQEVILNKSTLNNCYGTIDSLRLECLLRERREIVIGRSGFAAVFLPSFDYWPESVGS